MDSFSQWLGVDKATGKIVADGTGLPITALRRWSIEDQRKYPNANASLPPGMVLFATADEKATYCYCVNRKEAERARLLPQQ